MSTLMKKIALLWKKMPILRISKQQVMALHLQVRTHPVSSMDWVIAMIDQLDQTSALQPHVLFLDQKFDQILDLLWILLSLVKQPFLMVVNWDIVRLCLSSKQLQMDSHPLQSYLFQVFQNFRQQPEHSEQEILETGFKSVTESLLQHTVLIALLCVTARNQ